MAKLIDLIVSGKSSFASDINAKIIYSTRLYMSGAISTCNTPGSWVSGMTNAAIRYNDNAAITTSSYHPFLSMKAAGGHVVNFGGLNNTIGFYGFYNGRTANNYDWWFTVNSATGKWSMSESITSSAFITSGGANTQVVRGDGTLALLSTLSVGNADTLDNYHASGLFTDLSNSGNNISVTVGGTNKTLTVGYASNADTVDGYHASQFATSGHTHDSRYLRKDTNDSTEYQYSFTKTDGHAIQVGTIRGRAVGSLTGEIIHLCDRVHIGSPQGWGSRNAPNNGLSTYGGAWLATDTGNVGIGTTSPAEKLHVNGSANITGQTWLNDTIYIISFANASTLQSYGLPSNYNAEDFLKAWTKFAYAKAPGRTVIGNIRPNSRGMIQADVYPNGINSSSGLPEHITGRYYPHGGSEVIFGTSYGTWYYKVGIDSGNISSQSVNYATSAGNADTLDNYHASGLFTDLSNSGNNISVTVGGTTKTLTVGYATSSVNANKIYIHNSSSSGTYPVLFTNIGSIGTPRYDSVYIDSASGAGYNPNTNSFIASHMTAGTHNSTSTLYLSSGNSTSSIVFQIGGVEKAILLKQNGYLGIGTTNPAYPLSVTGTIHATTGFNANGKAVIDDTGRFIPASASCRNAGAYGVYDSHKVGHVWSMGTSYSISADGSSTNNLYGLAYFHSNWSNSADYNKDGKTEVSSYAGGHQIAMVKNGQVNAALGDYIWTRGGFVKNGSGNSYVLLGGGGHKAVSDFATSGHTHTFASLTSKPTTISGYGITDAKIENGVITIGSNTITPITTLSNCLGWTCMINLGTGSPASNALEYLKNLTNLNNGAKLVYNSYGVEYSMLFTRRNDSTCHGSILKWGLADTYLRILRVVSGNAKSADWEKISAGYADSAGDADKLDGVHASGLFTALSNSGNNISVTVGGTTKTLTVGYASNADTVDGYHHSDFVHTRSAIAGTDLNVYDINNSFIHDYIWTNAPTSNIIGSVIDLTYSRDWRYQIFCVPNSNNLIYTRARYSGTTWTNWKIVAFTDSDITGNAATATDADKLDGVHASGLFTDLSNSGNNISVTVGGTNKTLTVGYATSAGSATSATKLQTARTIWGQSFNGTGNVSGDLSGVTNINASGNIYAAAFYENSDVRLKKDVSSIVSSVNIPVIKEFKWKQTNHKSYGLIAQDLEAMGYPELVYIKDDGYKSVNYTAAYSLIIGKLQLKIKELEDRIKYIESK